ncbi:uncharacterized protein BDV14DRAFT_210828 [Aspergillus stella-maris]|uniref:uncharacterized protein n=1 Tax=Aspergillus stella-maris TaxID=1810926 RepID=UPI003CCCDEC4
MADPLEPIAIIGLSCRFSGTASNEHGFWKLLSKGMTTWTNNAGNRFRLSSFWHPDAGRLGSTNTQGLHLLQEDPALFDNDFFGISGIEAKAIDPQQRLLLEVAYEAFENAGLPLSALQGTNTGVYCAVTYADYDQILGRDADVSPTYRFTGTGPSMISNRISYSFDLRGPSITLDTACSSTLVALHEACRALRTGDMETALVGGTSLILDADKCMAMSAMTFLSPHGRCYAFDSRANGYGRGEGVAAVILKPLTAALRDGDSIRACIRGSAVGSDGRTPGITMPSPQAQLWAMRRAYEVAGLDPRETFYVEAHGTGTTAGDGCEAASFSQVFCKGRSIDQALYVGSVKSNIGHTEPTSGLASLIKAVLVLENETVPPNPTFKSPNPALHLDKAGIVIPTKLIRWPAGIAKRASVNSTGYGGTNAHVIVESRRDWSLNNGNVHNGCANENQLRIFLFTHQREHGLQKMAAIWKRFLMEHQGTAQPPSLGGLAYALGARRSLFTYRAAVVASDLDGLVAGLRGLEYGSSVRPTKTSSSPRICYVFTGQGAQWAGMGRELLSAYPVFEHSMSRSEKHLHLLGARWALLDELAKSEASSRLGEAELAQPCTTAVQIALVDLLASFGVSPAQVCGHSSGEIAAAYCLGVLSAADAMKVAYFRGLSVNKLREMAPDLRGGMLAVGISQSDATGRVQGAACQGKLTVACINSPQSVTVSGDLSSINQLSKTLDEEGVFNRRLMVDVAYHSYHMETVASFYRDAISDVSVQPLKQGISMASAVTGSLVEEQADLGPNYWVQNLVRPVRFSDSLTQAFLVLEIGPHAALKGPIAQTLRANAPSTSTSYHSCLVRNQDAVATVLTAVGAMVSHGVPISLDIINNNNRASSPQYQSHPVQLPAKLPSYNWHHEQRHWSESRRSIQYRSRPFPRHALLGSFAQDSISAEPTWHNYIRLSETPWLTGHRVDGATLFGSPGYISMVVEALRQTIALSNARWNEQTVIFKDITFASPLLLSSDANGVEVLTRLRRLALPSSSSSFSTPMSKEAHPPWHEFCISSISLENRATEHCRGLVRLQDSKSLPALSTHEKPTISTTKHTLWNRLTVPSIYRELDSKGITYSGAYLCVRSIRACPGHSVVEVEVPDMQPLLPTGHNHNHHSRNAQTDQIHPVALDGCFQAVFPCLKAAGWLDQTRVLTGIEEVRVSTGCAGAVAAGDVLSVRASAAECGPGQHVARFTAFANPSTSTGEQKKGQDGDLNQDSCAVFAVRGATFSAVGRGETPSVRDERIRPLCHRVDWALDPFSSPAEAIIAHCRRQRRGSDPDGHHPRLRAHADADAVAYCQSIIKATLTGLTSTDEAAVSGAAHRGLLNWMRLQDISAAVPLSEELESAVEASGAQGRALVRIGRHLGDILAGRADPMTLLSQNGLLDRVYIEHEGFKRCYAQLAEYVRLARFKVPGLRVLVVGGGQGPSSLTLTLLEALYGGSSTTTIPPENFVCTAVSSELLESTKQQVGKFAPLVTFQQLDVFESSASQGFQPDSFDLIVVSDALRAASGIEARLANIRTLLKPGGRVALIECTRQTLRGGLIFGGMDGWRPRMNATTWNGALKESGFAGVALEMKDYDSDDVHESSVLVAVAANHDKTDNDNDNATTAQSHGDGGKISIITAANSKDQDELASHLTTYIHRQKPKALISTVPLSSVEGRSLHQPSTSHTIIVLLEATADFLMNPPSSNAWVTIRDILCNAATVLWVSSGGAMACPSPQQALITGLARSLRSENHGINLHVLDLEHDAVSATSVSQAAEDIVQVYSRVITQSTDSHSAWEYELAIRDRGLYIPRLVPDEACNEYIRDTVSRYHPRLESGIAADPDRALELHIRSPGAWDTLFWKDAVGADTASVTATTLAPTQISVRVEYAAVSVRTYMVAAGHLSGSSSSSKRPPPLLTTGSGTIIAVGEAAKAHFSIGDAVYLFAPNGLSTTTTIDIDQGLNHPCALPVPVPRSMTLQDAASTPLAYATALFSLRDTARLQEGETVLVHSAATDPVGQAAVQLARYFRAKEVLVTVGSEEERVFLGQTEAGTLRVCSENIFSLDDDDDGDDGNGNGSFVQRVMRATQGKGVDVILVTSSPSGGDDRVDSKVLGALAPFGRVVVVDVSSGCGYGCRGRSTGITLDSVAHAQAASCAARNITFSRVDMAALATERGTLFQSLMRTALDMLGSGSGDGHLQPIQPVSVVHAANVADHFAAIQGGRQLGQLLLKIDDSEPLNVQPQKPTPPALDPRASYLVTGGTGGLGKELVRHLGTLGAKQIITLSRSGGDAPGIQELVNEMQQVGVELRIVKGNVCDRDAVERVKASTGERPIRGVVHGVMDLSDSLLQSMTQTQWADGIAVKVTGTLNLVDALSTPSPSTPSASSARNASALTFFILLGSTGAITGNQGQANYCAGNTFQDAIARHHANKGHPFRAIDVGMVAEVGSTAENEAAARFASAQGHRWHGVAQLLAAVDFAIAYPRAEGPDKAQVMLGARREGPNFAGADGSALGQRGDARFSHIWAVSSQEQSDQEVDTNKDKATNELEIQAAIRTATTPKAAIEATYAGLQTKVARLLDMAVSEIQPDRSVVSYGVDSLIELQLRNWISGVLGGQVTTLELMSSMSVVQLAEVVARRSRWVAAAVFAGDGRD